MSLHLPSKRVLRATTSSAASQPSSFLIPRIQRRSWFWSAESKKAPVAKNSLTEEFLRKKPAGPPGGLVRGDLSSSSIFGEDASGPKRGPTSSGGRESPSDLQRNPQTMAAALDPTPASRKAWEKKMVIRQVRKRDRLTKAQVLKRTERESLAKSHDFKTSVKKLNPLARQIAGKTIDDAIVQMRFSKKKAARDVLEHLEHARNEAVVKRGMGLGEVQGKTLDQPLKLMTKDGKRIKVEDPTRIYVDQAWVGKGLFQRTPDYRARGQVYMMQNPTTSLSVVLKEEATRIRLHNERETKARNKKVWVQLPNRPITAQRQHYSW